VPISSELPHKHKAEIRAAGNVRLMTDPPPAKRHYLPMEWLYTHWTALVGIGLLVWAGDQILKSLAAIKVKPEPAEALVRELVEMTALRRP
jgi:hypothetical protein